MSFRLKFGLLLPVTLFFASKANAKKQSVDTYVQSIDCQITIKMYISFVCDRITSLFDCKQLRKQTILQPVTNLTSESSERLNNRLFLSTSASDFFP